jgi:aarF domain-containing kinase
MSRRLLMILKLSDLQRSLDQSLATTHGQSRIFVIVARYCAKAGKLTLSSLDSS